MAPARRLGDRARFAPSIVEIAEPGISIGLEDPGITDEMPARVLAAAVAGVKERRCGRVWAGERPVIPDISPQSANYGFTLGEHRHGGVVTMDAFGAKHVTVD